jgi:hypothetical protein
LVQDELPIVQAELSFAGKFEKVRRHVRLDFAAREARVVPVAIDRPEQATAEEYE